MSTSLWLLVSFLAGWFALGQIEPAPTTTEPEKPEVDPPPSGSAIEGPPKPVAPKLVAPLPLRRIWLMRFLAVAVASVFLATALLEDLAHDGAFDFEKALVSDRLAQTIILFICGVVAAAFRTEIRASFGAGITHFTGAHDMLGWPSQMAAVILILMVVVVGFHPEIFDKLTAIKAGEIEADFASLSGSSIKDAPVDFKDERRSVTVGNWEKFSITRLPAEPLAVGQTSEQRDKADEAAADRSGLYLAVHGDPKRLNWSNALFKKQLLPLFSTIACFDNAGLTEMVQNDDDLASLAAQYRNALRNAITGKEDLAKGTFALSELHVLAAGVQTELLQKFNTAKIKLGGVVQCNPTKIESDTLDADMKAIGCTRGDPFVCSTTEEASYLWDGYAMAAIADLTSFTDDQRASADLLVEVAAPLLDPKKSCGEDNCGRHTPAIFNLSYAVVAAQVNGGGPWPLDLAEQRLDATLEGIEEILWHQHDGSESCLEKHNGWCTQRRFLLQSEFIDLSLGLELLQDHALAGEKLRPQDLARWRLWLNRTQLILQEIKSINAQGNAVMERSKAAAWRDAAAYIGQDIASIADIEANATLSPLLLAQQTGRPTSEDCLASRAVFTHLRQIDFKDVIVAIGKQNADTYTGFLNQIGNRISVACAG